MMQFALDNARRLGIAGFIRRFPTGTLHMEAEGEEEKLNEFVKLFEARPDWLPENKIIINDKILGLGRFYIKKQG